MKSLYNLSGIMVRIVEGEGYKSPKPIQINLDMDDLSFIRRRAKLVAAQKGYKIDNLFIGFCGEMATAKYFSKFGWNYLCEIAEYFPTGDGGIDITINGYTIQVKTSRGELNRVIRIYKNKKLSPLSSEFYIFSKCNIDISETSGIVNIKGWITKSDLGGEYGKLSKYPNGDFCLIVDNKYLNPMEQLKKLIKGMGKRS